MKENELEKLAMEKSMVEKKLVDLQMKLTTSRKKSPQVSLYFYFEYLNNVKHNKHSWYFTEKWNELIVRAL